MNTRTVIAGILILIGALLLFDNVFHISIGGIIGDWWPMILVIIGVSTISKSRGSIFSGLVLVIVGIVLQAWELNWIQGGLLSIIWPLILILIGVSLFSNTKNRRNRVISDDEVDMTTIFGGSGEKINSSNFKGGDISAIFGGATIDLRNAELSPEGALLNITTAFGGVELIVPENWRIMTKGTPILGALDNKTHINIDNNEAPLLKVSYFVIFGGIDIKNYKN